MFVEIMVVPHKGVPMVTVLCQGVCADEEWVFEGTAGQSQALEQALCSWAVATVYLAKSRPGWGLAEAGLFPVAG